MNHQERTPDEDLEGIERRRDEGQGHGNEEVERVDVELDEVELDEVELAEDDGSLGDALRALLQPPEAIGDRVADTVSEHLASRSTSGVALDLLGLGARTLAVMLTGEAPRADRSSVDIDVDVHEQSRRVDG